jgi:hypothetical protein
MERFWRLSSFVLSCLGLALLVVALLAVPNQAFGDFALCQACCTAACGSDSACIANCETLCAVGMGVCGNAHCPGNTCDYGCITDNCFMNNGCTGTNCPCNKPGVANCNLCECKIGSQKCYCGDI